MLHLPTQKTQTYCSIASSVTVLNALASDRAPIDRDYGKPLLCHAQALELYRGWDGMGLGIYDVISMLCDTLQLCAVSSFQVGSCSLLDLVIMTQM